VKYRRKITARERWVLAFLPTVAISGIYLYGIYPGYAADLATAQQHLAAASGPPPKVAPAPSAAKTKVADLKKKIADDQIEIPKIQAHLDSLRQAQLGEQADAAGVIQSVESDFAADQVTPLLSEPIIDSASKGPDALLSALVADTTSDIGDGRQGPRVWHYIFDDTTQNLQKAVNDMTASNPTVVPLSMNLVYNPENSGATRLLELWLLY